MNLSTLRRAAGFLAILLAAAAHAPAQTASSNALPTPPTPPMPAVPSYLQVRPGFTLHELSPVVYFRSILGMTPSERTNALAGKSDDFKKGVLDKVQEYQSLPADIREARLQETQLRWDLITLMRVAPAARLALLKDVAAKDRVILENRLGQWDHLSLDRQKAFLEKESFLDFYIRWQNSSAAEQQASLRNLPPARRQELTNELARWEVVPEAVRTTLCDEFHQFFEMNSQQQNQTLDTFTGAERRAMVTALGHFAGLTPAQRAACINSFQEFATMSADQRNQFLINADRWESMSQEERNLWRELVQRFPVLPPMPPGMQRSDLPPSPPGMTNASLAN